MADRSRGPRMPKHWHAIPGFEASLTVNATVLGGALASLLTPFTVIRMLGEYVICADAAPTAQDNCSIGVGIGVVSTDAAAIGSTAMPDPIGETEFPWLYWAEHDFFFNEASLVGNDARVLRRSFDVRSMRKIAPRQSLVMIVQYADTAGAPPMQITASQTRVLVAE